MITDFGVIIIIALAPSLFWLWFFYKQDTFEVEPLRVILKMFLLGMIITIPAIIFEEVFSLIFSVFVLTVIIGPIIEELSKFSIVREIEYNDIKFDEPVEGVTYSVSTALGFATIENIIYLLYQPSLLSIAFTGVIRALFTIPAHAIFAIFWGYALGIVKFHAAGKTGKYLIISGLLLGIVVHCLFNFLLMQNLAGFAVLILVVFPLMLWFAEEDIHKSLIITYKIKHKNLNN
jgi:RsiW-degrading membrane proteinase PrsW (M82 family)